jgi:hypothetical protein
MAPLSYFVGPKPTPDKSGVAARERDHEFQFIDHRILTARP